MITAMLLIVALDKCPECNNPRFLDIEDHLAMVIQDRGLCFCQQKDLEWIIGREHGWFAATDQKFYDFIDQHDVVRCKNPNSTAYGVGQFLDTTWVNGKIPYRINCQYCQLDGMVTYIKERYGTIVGAKQWHQEMKWY